MNVQELERLAIASHDGELKECDYDSGELGDYEQFMGIRFADRIAQVRQHYPTEPIIVADLGCHTTMAASQMNGFEGVAAFGLDDSPCYNPSHGLPKSRVIRADLNDMKQIPDETFHYLLSFNCLSYTEVPKSFPEIFRVLKAGGIADLDLEFWLERNVPELRSLRMRDCLFMVGIHSGYRGNLEDYIKHLKELQQTGRSGVLNMDCRFTRFEMVKPTTKPA